MRGLTHRWLIPAEGPGTNAGLPGVEPMVARLLASRGLHDRGQAALFMEPRLGDLHDPVLLPGAEEAAARLLDALRRGRRIVVYADYDVDGICAGAILHRACRAVAPSADVHVYIPHRLEEGYGLNEEAIRSLAEDGADLIISVDCGVTAIRPAMVARELGVELIITDHHNFDAQSEGLPDVDVLVHPRHPLVVEQYPCPDICGAGVAFKVAWKLCVLACGSEKVSPALRGTLIDLLSMAAMGTIADVVPLQGENRIIARHGLAALRSSTIVGLRALLESCALLDGPIGSDDVGFQIAPRLNAAGRMGHARDALELMLTDDADRARTIARELSRLNEKRKATEREIAEHAAERAELAGMTGGTRRGIVLCDESWHPGVIGIACSRLVGRYHRPVILLGRTGDECKGSGRSIDGFNLHDALVRCSDQLRTFGGHDMAVGLSLDAARLEEFTERFISFANERIDDEALVPSLRVDCTATINELSPLAVRQLAALEPYGRSNPRPSILVRGVSLASDAKTFGAAGAHASLHVRAGHGEMRLVAWRWGERAQDLRAGARLDVVVRPKLNSFRGRVTVEPEVRDVRIAEPVRSSL